MALRLVTLVVTWLAAAAASAAPPSLQTGSATDGDVYIELSVPGRAIHGDAASACTLRVWVSGAELPLTAGDTVRVAVYEYDPLASDDVVFTYDDPVTEAHVAQGSFEATYDCRGPFHDDSDGVVEIYAEVQADKYETPWYASHDLAVTGSLAVSLDADDAGEPDDARTAARAGVPTFSGIARNGDWSSVTLTQVADVVGGLELRRAEGALDLRLTDAAGTVLATGTDVDSGARVEVFALAAGTYYIEVAPRAAGDFNYYDLTTTLRGAGGCQPGAQESVSCGRCGRQTRTCDALSQWGGFGACEDQGECVPDAVLTETCGTCGSRPRTCNSSCQYVTGVCFDPCDDPLYDLGEACTGVCRAGLTCLTTGYPGGYCSKDACDSSTACGERGLCGVVDGEARCLRRCSSDEQCRDGYVCSVFAGDGACIPSGAANGGPWTGVRPADDDRQPATSIERQGCGAGVAPWWAVLTALIVGSRRRRR